MLLAALTALLLLAIPASSTAGACRESKACVKRVKLAHMGYDFCNTFACVNRVERKRYHRYVSRLPYVGPDGRRWAIPWYIVNCESHGRWEAYNPSGASGPYQLLGWGAPMPANTYQRKLAHHRIAARLWAGGSGASHWVCR